MKARFVQTLLVLGTLVLASQAEIAANRGQPNSADEPEHGVGSPKSPHPSDRKSQELPFVSSDESEPSGNQKVWDTKSQHSEDEYINLKYSVKTPLAQIESRLEENFQDAAEPAEVPAPAEPEVPETRVHDHHETYEHRYKHGVVPARLPAQENDRAHRFRHSIIHGYGEDIHA